MKLSFEDIVIIDKQYLAYLHSFDERVRENHENAKDRPNIAVLVDDSGQKWAIPLSSSVKGEDDSEIYYNIRVHSLGSLERYGHMKFNNMIPLVNNTYASAFGKDQKYNKLLHKQERIILNNFATEVEPRFKKAFYYSKLAKEKPGNKFYNMFNNFALLKQKADNWEFVSKAEVFIDKALKIVPPKEKDALNVLDKVLKRDDYKCVLQFRETTKQNFEQIYKNLKEEKPFDKDLAAKRAAMELLRLEKEGLLNLNFHIDNTKERRKDQNEWEKD